MYIRGTNHKVIYVISKIYLLQMSSPNINVSSNVRMPFIELEQKKLFVFHTKVHLTDRSI